jgi:hypothetical protein
MRKSVLFLALIFAGCHGTSYNQKQVVSPCSGGPPSQGFACIGPDLVPTQNPIHGVREKFVHAFFTSGSDELVIASEIFEHTGHQGGHAWGQVKKDAVVGKRYKYTILDVTTGKVNDPEVMIDPSP